MKSEFTVICLDGRMTRKSQKRLFVTSRGGVGKMKCPYCGSTRFRLLSRIEDEAEVDDRLQILVIFTEQEPAFFNPEEFYTAVKCAEYGAEIDRDKFFEAVRNYKLEVR